MRSRATTSPVIEVMVLLELVNGYILKYMFFFYIKGKPPPPDPLIVSPRLWVSLFALEICSFLMGFVVSFVHGLLEGVFLFLYRFVVLYFVFYGFCCLMCSMDCIRGCFSVFSDVAFLFVVFFYGDIYNIYIYYVYGDLYHDTFTSQNEWKGLEGCMLGEEPSMNPNLRFTSQKTENDELKSHSHIESIEICFFLFPDSC